MQDKYDYDRSASLLDQGQNQSSQVSGIFIQSDSSSIFKSYKNTFKNFQMSYKGGVFFVIQTNISDG